MSDYFDEPGMTENEAAVHDPKLRLSTTIVRPGFRLVASNRDYEDLCRSISNTQKLSFDYETSDPSNANYLQITEKKRPIDFYKSTITGASYRTSDGMCYYHSIDHLDSFNMPPESVRDALLCKPKSAPICAHNLAFEWTISKKCLGLDLRDLGPLRDTMVAAFVLDSSQAVGLKDLVRRNFNILQQSYSAVTGGLKMNEISAARTYWYGCDDSEFQWELDEKFMRMLAEVNLVTYFENIEMPIVPIIAEMSLRGTPIDLELLEGRAKEAVLKMNGIEREVVELIGRPINLASPKQVGRFLYEDLKLPRPPYATSDSASDKESLFWNIDLHPAVAKILEYRKYETRNKLYYKPYPKLVNPASGNIHSQLRQTVAVTGRFSSSGPNLQQLAKRGDGAEVRELFIPPPGYDYILSADMSQVELVLAGHRSKSKVLLEAYGEKRGDVHTATCMALFNIDALTAKKNKTYRSAGKTTNFTLIYGGAAKRVYRQVKLDLAKMGLACPFTLRDIELMILAYFRLYPEIKDMQRNDVNYAKAYGYVKSLYGRRYYLPHIHAREGWKRAEAERAATNYPIQGSCAELNKKAIINIYNERIPIEDAVMWTSIHDENVFYVREPALKDVAYIVHKHMAFTPAGLRTNMESELTIGPNFGKMKGIPEYTL